MKNSPIDRIIIFYIKSGATKLRKILIDNYDIIANNILVESRRRFYILYVIYYI